MSSRGKFLSGSSPKKPRKPIWFKVFLILFILIAAGAAGFIVYLQYVINKPLETEPLVTIYSDPVVTEAPETEPTTEPNPFGKDGRIINVMIVGQSAREGADGKLSDTLILCTINTGTKVVTMTSILRDTFVNLPSFVDKNGYHRYGGEQRINAAYSLGYMWGGTEDAMKYLKLTMKEVFGVEVDHTVEIGFDAFEEVIDALGGVKLELNEDEAKYMNKYFKGVGMEREFVVGVNSMNGWEALVFARMRHSNYGDNDFKRTSRQRVLMEKLLEKCKRRNIFQLTKIAKQVLPYIETDMGVKDTLSFALEMIPMVHGLKMESNQCPAPGTFWGEMIELNGVEAGVLKFDAWKNRLLLKDLAESDHE